AATDLRDMFTSTPDFTPYTFQQIQFAQGANAVWLALTKDIDFSQPDADEVKLHEAIMKSEGLPRHTALEPEESDIANHNGHLCPCCAGQRLALCSRSSIGC